MCSICIVYDTLHRCDFTVIRLVEMFLGKIPTMLILRSHGGPQIHWPEQAFPPSNNHQTIWMSDFLKLSLTAIFPYDFYTWLHPTPLGWTHPYYWWQSSRCSPASHSWLLAQANAKTCPRSMGETTTKHIFTTWWVWLNSPLAGKTIYMDTMHDFVRDSLLGVPGICRNFLTGSSSLFQIDSILLASFPPSTSTQLSARKCDKLLHCSDQELLRFHSNNLRFLIFRCNCGV